MRSHVAGALKGVEMVVPHGPRLDAVHGACVPVPSTSFRSTNQGQGFLDAGRAPVDERGTAALLLAGTDLALAVNVFSARLRALDGAAAHVRPIGTQAHRPRSGSRRRPARCRSPVP